MAKLSKIVQGPKVPEYAPLPTETEWGARLQSDKDHKQSRPGHLLSIEIGSYNGKPMERSQCVCGWKGEWTRPEAQG